MERLKAFLLEHEADIGETLGSGAAETILESLILNYYDNDFEVIHRPHMQEDVLANLVKRQTAFEKFLVPWINDRFSLKNARVADVGCGTGCSTAAFARVAAVVRGYDISGTSIQVASDRLSSLGQRNAAASVVHPHETINRILADFPAGPDVIALIAVLEHMTPAERAVFLPAAWSILPPGGILVVAELPNRLTYFDDHTAQIPFFHMLPERVRLEYASRSPRSLFSESLASYLIEPVDDKILHEALCRWGVGLSYHDFEIGFGVDKLENIILADGYEFFSLTWWPVTLEERILMEYFLKKPILKPLGFCRSVLNFIFIKPFNDQRAIMLAHDKDYITGVFKWNGFSDEALQRMLQEGTV